MKLFFVDGAANLQEIDKRHNHDDDAQQHERNANNGRVMNGTIACGSGVLQTKFAQQQTEAFYHETKGNRGEAGAYPGEKGALIRQVISYFHTGSSGMSDRVLRCLSFLHNTFFFLGQWRVLLLNNAS